MIRTPAKINLFLKVTGSGENSYHTLNTLFMPLANPADELELRFDAEPGIRISCSAPEVPGDERNLCYRAAALYADRCGIAPAWEISLKKNIPVAAGMGGGSSDAAAVLLLLNRHCRRANDAELAALALDCGADVPFFLAPRPALATGYGNRFEYPEPDFPEIPLLLVNPGFPISAAWAYRNLSPETVGALPSGYEQDFLTALRRADLKRLAGLIHNDLAPAAYRKFPVLRLLRNELLEAGAAAAEITGSGPTLFALCKSFKKRDELAAVFRRNYPQLTVMTSSLK
ncbi:MAG: 4-(cytidine 5'-diphospho)-2-C-methyl-D-erythritol kinase [Victivallaceae bacterium]|nr:4-(cytidine 5'-diphospho)-2-C-methyl-D-erythritol kinase [Victivallaceae bacterium]